MKYLFLLILLVSLPAWSSPAEEREDSIALLDSAQNLFGNRINALANRLDSFFATERADDEFGRSTIRISSTYEMREQELPDLNNRYRINLKLPHLEEKFRYRYYSKEFEEEKVKSVEESREIKERVRVRKGWIFNADAGVNATIPPRLVLRSRVRRNFETGTLIHRFAEQLTYMTDASGLVEETTLETDHTLTPEILFRFVNSKRWGIFEKKFTTRHGPNFIQQLTEDDALRYSLTAISIIDEGTWFINNYRLQVNYRRNLYQDWIYFDLIPGLDFAKKYFFRRNPYLQLRIEVLFGG